MSIPNYLYALANHKGPATVNAGGLSIPVKIMDINHDSGIYESDKTTFKCLVVNQDEICVSAAKAALNSIYGAKSLANSAAKKEIHNEVRSVSIDPMKIKRVIFSYPATIVLWADGTKTVVKCQEGDAYSKDTGLALCIAKKALGNTSKFNDVFHKWIPEEEEEPITLNVPVINPIDDIFARLTKAARDAARAIEVYDHE